jgi:hypothetical protein
MHADWETWDWETVHREIASLGVPDLVGESESDITTRFGQPDDVARPGGVNTDATGKIAFSAEASWTYYRLLAHTCFSLDILDGRVAQVAWWPKWKRVPLALQATESGAYAPE